MKFKCTTTYQGSGEETSFYSGLVYLGHREHGGFKIKGEDRREHLFPAGSSIPFQIVEGDTKKSTLTTLPLTVEEELWVRFACATVGEEIPIKTVTHIADSLLEAFQRKFRKP